MELQRDMSLYGVTDDRSAVVIDATGLPVGRPGVVRIGLGSNTIEWLTVLGPPEAAAGIATELEGTASTRIRVAHVVSGGTSRGVDVRNVGMANAGRRIVAEIVDNELFGPTYVVGMSAAIRVATTPNGALPTADQPGRPENVSGLPSSPSEQRAFSDTNLAVPRLIAAWPFSFCSRLMV